ncbi:MAG: membrane protein insertion efficiency factor YidD [Candidatus Margulisbacteria bacterium]|nr:membrane protein insertion efficiency factor YidD [Candidatus Margulisiibacteriota bacterium]
MVKNTLIFLIRIYKKYSPLTPKKCRFYPTCSSYALEAITRYGVFKGGSMSTYRLLRCNPWNPGGYDPVK